jgi:hypothetical protein
MEEVFSGVLPLLAIEGTEICSLRDTHSPKSKLALVELLRMHGIVLARQCSWDEAERAFEEAVSVAQSVRYPYAETRAIYERGLMYVDGPDKKRGRERLEEGS